MLFLALFLLAFRPDSAQARHPFVPGAEPPRAPIASVQYYGGPVISHVKVVLVYWGEGVDAGTQAQLAKFYRGLVTGNYLDLMAEYGTRIRAVDGREGTNQDVGRGSLAGAFTIHPVNTARSLSQADVEAELEAQLARGALPKPDADSYYAIHFPDGYRISISFGLSCSSWYADHEVYRSKAFGPVFYAMMPCDSGDSSNLSELTFASSHELTEAVSDPMSPLANEPTAFPAGWIRADGEEIADLCTGSRGTLAAEGETFAVSGLWRNSENACRAGSFTAQVK